MPTSQRPPCQRWRLRRPSYRPPGETVDTARFEVAPIAGDATPKAFVEAHHYSGSYPAARFRYGLYRVGGPRAGALAGVAVFGQPFNPRVLTRVFDGDPAESTELSRFVLLDDVPGNGETWFLGRCFEGLRAEGLHGVLSFSDPVRRRTKRGAVVTPGHVGTIYQAHNARYLERATARTLWLFDDGTTLSDDALRKLLHGKQGWRYAARLLADKGLPPPPLPYDDPDGEWDGDAAAAYWAGVSGRLRRLRHPGNHRYGWGLDPRTRRRMRPNPDRYPKR